MDFNQNTKDRYNKLKARLTSKPNLHSKNQTSNKKQNKIKKCYILNKIIQNKQNQTKKMPKIRMIQKKIKKKKINE